MSGCWTLGIKCNGCGRRFGEYELDSPLHYGIKLQTIRALAAEEGWTSRTAGRAGNTIYDYCASCSQERA